MAEQQEETPVQEEAAQPQEPDYPTVEPSSVQPGAPHHPATEMPDESEEQES